MSSLDNYFKFQSILLRQFKAALEFFTAVVVFFLLIELPRESSVLLKAFELAAMHENFHLDIYGSILDSNYKPWIDKLKEQYPDKIDYHGGFDKNNIRTRPTKL